MQTCRHNHTEQQPEISRNIRTNWNDANWHRPQGVSIYVYVHGQENPAACVVHAYNLLYVSILNF